MLLIVILFLILISLVGTSKIKNKITIKKETAICLIAGVIRMEEERKLREMRLSTFNPPLSTGLHRQVTMISAGSLHAPITPLRPTVRTRTHTTAPGVSPSNCARPP